MSRIFKNDTVFTPTKLTVHEMDLPETGRIDTENTLQKEQSNSNDAAKEQENHLSGQENTTLSPEDVQYLQNQSYQKGVREAQVKVEEKFQSTLETLLEACQKLDFLRSTILLQSKEHMINIIIALSKAILKQELTIKRDIIASTLEAALDQAIQNDEYQITVHPDDLAVVEKMKPDIIATIRSLEHIVLKVDSQLTRGGCLIESDTCSVDATIETQLINAKKYLTEHTLVTTSESPGEDSIQPKDHSDF